MTTSQHPVVIVGGGIAGLTAAALLGRDGVPVVLVEKASTPGGRATTRNRNGFLFNLGPHALYRAGVLHQTLKTLGVTVRGGVPGAGGGYAIYEGRLHTLPTGLTSLISTGLLSLSAKFELARFQTRLAAIDTNAIRNEPLGSWLEANISDATVRQLLAMLTRVTTFTNDLAHQSAGAALEQIKLGVKANALYLDGGWQTIVDGLRRAAIANGARIVTGAHANDFEVGRPEGLRDNGDRGAVTAVRLADGSSIPASGVIIAGAPADVDALAGTAFAAQMTPVRVATLDIALRSLPNPRANVAFGVDVPWYYSVHSAVANLAPPGQALIHVAKYLRPGERARHDVEEELESVMDLMQPGWQTRVEHKQFVPSLTVTHAEITTAAAPTGSGLQPFDNVFIAGDWVGPRGQLSDRAAASAADAVAAVQTRHRQLRAIA